MLNLRRREFITLLGGAAAWIEMHETQGLQQLKVISEIVHVNLTPAEINGSSEPLLIEGDGAHNNGGGNGGFEQR